MRARSEEGSPGQISPPHRLVFLEFVPVDHRHAAAPAFRLVRRLLPVSTRVLTLLGGNSCPSVGGALDSQRDQSFGDEEMGPMLVWRSG